MPITAKVIEDSISEAGVRITTLQLLYPRFIHSEFMTHRVFSRNASSSRAIPVKKMLEMVRNDPAMPIHWGANQPGMQAKSEIQHVGVAKDLWLIAARNAADVAEEMEMIGLHKQVANRILEPFQHIQVVLTSTMFDNWDELRDHDDADPNIHELARVMKVARSESEPSLLFQDDWHLPYVSHEERVKFSAATCVDVSAARCCRVSYLKHDGTAASVEEEQKLCARLIGARPLHASPFEHQATPDVLTCGIWNEPELHGNFHGWIQNRKCIEDKFK